MIHIDWQHLLTQYGYLAILVGTFLEGESILILGGYAAHQGYLFLPHVLLAAFAGSFFGDQLYFAVGRMYGRAFLATRPAWRARVARVNGLLQRYQTAYILGFRFLYGLRTLSPFVLGAGPVKTLRFVLLNAAGAILWTLTIGSIGYAFGEMVTLMLGRAKHYEAYVLGAILVIGIVVTVTLHRRAKHRSQRPAAVEPPPIAEL
jgi:membrane protein DedA with SNARE-associated domain